MNTEKTITILNQFLSIQNERFDNFEINILETNDSDLKSLLYKYQQKCFACKWELKEEIKALGGIPVQEDIVNSKKILHLWLDLKNIFMTTNREDLLYICEYNEFLNIKKFRNLLDNNSQNLSSYQIQMLKKQLILLQKNHDYLKFRGDILLNQGRNQFKKNQSENFKTFNNN